MIIDRIENIGYYESVLPGLSNGLKTLKQLASLESGRHEFEGGFLMIQEGDTKPMEEGTFEAHRFGMWMFRLCCVDARNLPGRNIIN